MSVTNAEPRLRIGELAAEFRLNPRTIRYYEDIGLLPPPKRTSAGYRVYNETDVERLRFIAKAKVLRLSLEEIAEILQLRDGGGRPCDHVLALLDRKLAAVEEQLHALLELRDDLWALRAEAAEMAPQDAAICAIIEQYDLPSHKYPDQVRVLPTVRRVHKP